MKDSGLPILEKRTTEQTKQALKNLEELAAHRKQIEKSILDNLHKNAKPLKALIEGWLHYKEVNTWDDPTFEDFLMWLYRELE